MQNEKALNVVTGIAGVLTIAMTIWDKIDDLKAAKEEKDNNKKKEKNVDFLRLKVDFLRYSKQFACWDGLLISLYWGIRGTAQLQECIDALSSLDSKEFKELFRSLPQNVRRLRP